jgi:hypothetical protein
VQVVVDRVAALAAAQREAARHALDPGPPQHDTAEREAEQREPDHAEQQLAGAQVVAEDVDLVGRRTPVAGVVVTAERAGVQVGEHPEDAALGIGDAQNLARSRIDVDLALRALPVGQVASDGPDATVLDHPFGFEARDRCQRRRAGALRRDRPRRGRGVVQRRVKELLQVRCVEQDDAAEGHHQHEQPCHHRHPSMAALDDALRTAPQTGCRARPARRRPAHGRWR